jgi:hypothetical protein
MPLLLLLGIIPDVCLAQAYFGSGNWCLVLDEIQDCSFNAADNCYAAAGAKGGYCQENARKQRVAGLGAWCVVSASGRDCRYGDQRSCLQEALRVEGGCVPNTERALENTQLKNASGGVLGNDEDGPVNSLEDLGARLEEAQRLLQEQESLQGAQ